MTDFLKAKTPCWLFDPDIAVGNYLQFTRLFKNAVIAYAIKSNPHPALNSSLHKAGAGFCVVSPQHLKKLLALGVSPSKIVYSHAIKSLEDIQFALQNRVKTFACDSESEIDKLAFFNDTLGNSSPTEIFIRLDVDNTGSVIPLSEKFGIKSDVALQLMYYAKKQDIKPIGFSFHPGSQCLRLETWENAIKTVSKVWKPAQETFDIDFLNIGGGFSAPYENCQGELLENTAKTIYTAIDQYLPGVKRLVLEPGRAISATAGSLLTTVTGSAERPDGKIWLYIDAGVFSGLFETMDGIHYPVTVLPATDDSLQAQFQKTYPEKPFKLNAENKQFIYMLAGPTCDSLDKLFTITVDKPIQIGDRLLFKNTGAYGFSLECAFNGHESPSVKILSQQSLPSPQQKPDCLTE